jgi:uncharacterized protein YciI
VQRFVILFTRGQIWKVDKPFWEQQWDGHKDYWLKIGEEGKTHKVHAGGPFLNHTGGMVIIDIESEEDLKKIIERDPAVKNKLLDVTIYPWQPVVSNF